MPKLNADAVRRSMNAALGADLRAIREAACVSQQTVADLFGWGKSAISKMENGTINVFVADYCLILRFLRDHLPEDHPGHELIERFMPRGRSRR